MPDLGWSIRRQVTEIGGDRVLQLYGAALATVNALAAIHWLWDRPALSEVLSQRVPPICWPFFETCYGLRALTPAGITCLVGALLVAALMNAAMFVLGKNTSAAYWLLLGVTSLKYFVVFQDFRLTLNHHYMALWVSGTFLFIPRKRQALKGLLVAMYIWAGVLKVHPDSQWLSGGAFYGARPLGLPASLIPAECLYVIVLELVIVLGLLSRRQIVFWLAFGQVVLFHVASFWVVGWFYPVLMFCLLSIFAMDRLSPQARGAHDSEVATAWWRPGEPSACAMVVALSLAQLPPLALSSDAAMTGEGRIFALNMFDAPVECRAVAIVRGGRGVRDSLRLRPPFLNTRNQCDPIVYLGAARNYCRAFGERPDERGGDDIDVTLRSRRSGDPTFATVAAIPSACTTSPHYNLFRHNPWILR